jgi:hypothetical protein
MTQFIGRTRELKSLNSLTGKRVGSMAVIKGRCRIGKTRLIQEFAKDFETTYFFNGAPPTPETTRQSQIDEFTRQMCRNFELPEQQFMHWGDVFHVLGRQVQDRKILMLWDEISWIGSKDHLFVPYIKNLWDLSLSQNDQLIFIMCGSASAWIERNIIRSKALYGRPSLYMTLEELPLDECAQFPGLNPRRLVASEIVKILSVTGGVPKYLEQINPELSPEQNIQNLCFAKGGYLVDEFDKVFSSEFLTRSRFYQKALELLVHRPLSAQAICDGMGVVLNKTRSGYLDELEEAGLIERDYAWRLRPSSSCFPEVSPVSEVNRFRLKDNYSRFYLKYILPHKRKIQKGLFEGQPLATLPDWDTFMELQLENLVLGNHHKLLKLLNISWDELVFCNPFFQEKTSEHPECQVNYLIQTIHSELYVCVLKFSSTELGMDIIPEMEKKIKALQKQEEFSCKPVLIHVNGVHKDVEDQKYFSKIFDFGRLLKDSGG